MSYLLVANGEPPSEELLQALLKTHTSLVAVDGGLNTCLRFGLEPNMIIGDFDSISDADRKKWSHIPQIHTPDQNKSDLEKALTYLFEQGAQKIPQKITVCAATGARLDHTLANICLLLRYPEIVKFESDLEICFALPKSVHLECQIGQTLSLIPMSDCSQIYTQGLKWELQGDNLNKNFVGISNVCLNNKISISFGEGDLLVCLNRTF